MVFSSRFMLKMNGDFTVTETNTTSTWHLQNLMAVQKFFNIFSLETPSPSTMAVTACTKTRSHQDLQETGTFEAKIFESFNAGKG